VPPSGAGQARLDSAAHSTPITGAARIVKRALDAFLGAMALIFLSPLLAALAVLIRLQDGGPAFYRRRVVGVEADFDAFKLRTMRTDADEILRTNPALRSRFEINFKLKDDPRVTRLGAFLRKASLDELPQLWNVLKGEMSLVGPRMINPAELEKYGDAAWIFRCVKPGLTGYWQVHAGKISSYDERVRMDLFYVKNWSLAFDLKILAMTPLRIVRGAGAD
jgi:lipopolysaccharide/colanic/teichoic acid biosynthesis glycosyltransferase